MMNPNQFLTLKVDLSKIEKEHTHKGKKGEYVDMYIVPTPNSPYGYDHMIVQSVAKDQREKGLKGPIIGNTKVWETHPKVKAAA